MKRVGLIGWRGMVGSVLMQRMLEERDFDLIEPVFFTTSNVGGQGPEVGKDIAPLKDAYSIDELKTLDVILTCQGGDYTSEVFPKLHDLLQNHGRLDLIVCGFMTHSSVSTTVRAAKDYGYRCTLADSACATRDIPTLIGGVLSAADLQRAEIAALGDNFAAIVAQARDLL